LQEGGEESHGGDGLLEINSRGAASSAIEPSETAILDLNTSVINPSSTARDANLKATETITKSTSASAGIGTTITTSSIESSKSPRHP